MRSNIGVLIGSGVIAASLLLGGCGKSSKPSFTYMPDMAYQPSLKAQEEGSVRMPVEGTIPRGFRSYPYPDDVEVAERNLKNPLPNSRQILLRGQKMFNTYCVVCHGQYGEGDGNIVPKFPRPPSLQSDRVKNFAQGRFYHIMTMGQNLMPSYASQITRKDRWAIARYIKVLHRAKSPTSSDIKAYNKEYNK